MVVTKRTSLQLIPLANSILNSLILDRAPFPGLTDFTKKVTIKESTASFKLKYVNLPAAKIFVGAAV
jgi:hypothetical protein